MFWFCSSNSDQVSRSFGLLCNWSFVFQQEGRERLRACQGISSRFHCHHFNGSAEPSTYTCIQECQGYLSWIISCVADFCRAWDCSPFFLLVLALPFFWPMKLLETSRSLRDKAIFVCLGEPDHHCPLAKHPALRVIQRFLKKYIQYRGKSIFLDQVGGKKCSLGQIWHIDEMCKKSKNPTLHVPSFFFRLLS